MATPPPGEAPESDAVDTGRRALGTWLWRLPVLAAVAAAGVGVQQAYRIHFSKEAPDPNPTFASVAAHDVAPLADFAAPWDAVEFVVAGVPSVAVRLPEPIPGGLSVADDLHLAAFSRVCTHLACIVELNRDIETVAFAFNHRSDGPSLTCACHFSVFDPRRAGRAVSGPAVRPLPRTRLTLRTVDGATWVVADGLERSG